MYIELLTDNLTKWNFDGTSAQKLSTGILISTGNDEQVACRMSADLRVSDLCLQLSGMDLHRLTLQEYFIVNLQYTIDINSINDVTEIVLVHPFYE